jgi:2-hydroxycyclohexanecarboxyl-CoA dehydrogenase
MNQSVVVTGAGGAMGQAIGAALAADGWRVIGIDLKFSGDHPHLAHRIEQDVADSGAFRAQLAKVASTCRVTGLVNCAGISRVVSFLEDEEANWRRMLDINFLAPVTACQELLPTMIANGGGAIVNITSDSGRIGAAGQAVYAGSKGGLTAFSKSLAQEVGYFGITVNCVSPGVIETPMSAPNQQLIAKLVRKIPMQRIGQPVDVARTTAFLLSRQADYVTGQVISVSGGLTMVG